MIFGSFGSGLLFWATLYASKNVEFVCILRYLLTCLFAPKAEMIKQYKTEN